MSLKQNYQYIKNWVDERINSIEMPDISGFVDRSVNDLVNYYLKSEVYTKSEIQQLITSINQFQWEVVQNLPTASADTMYKLYLVPSQDPSIQNIKDEYITVENQGSYSWERIGSTSGGGSSSGIDILQFTNSSGYLTEEQLLLIQSSHCVIKYNDCYYYKSYQGQNGCDYVRITFTRYDAGITDYYFTCNYTNRDYLFYYNEDNRPRVTANPTFSSGTTPVVLENMYIGGNPYSIPQGTYIKPLNGIPATDIENGVIPDVSNFITNSTNNLVNYYLKSDTYTKSEVQTLINAIQQFTYEIVSTLPSASDSTMCKIYLIPSANSQTQNIKDEYITIDNGSNANPRYTWEQIGSTSIDLSGYVTTQTLNTTLLDYITTSNLTTLLSTKANVATTLAGYGITDVNINNGVITIGSDTITPITQHQDITGKADKVTNAINGNFAGLDGNGNLTDSGKSDSDFLPANTSIPSSINDLSDVNLSTPSNGNVLTYDSTSNKWIASAPSGGSSGGVQDVTVGGSSVVNNGIAIIPSIPSISGLEATSNKVISISSSSTNTEYPSAKCVYDALQEKVQLETSQTLNLSNDTEHRIDSSISTINASTQTASYLNLGSSTPFISWIVFTSGSTAVSFSYPSEWKWSGDDVNNGAFVPITNKRYNVCVWWDGVCLNAIARGIDYVTI